MAGKRIVKRINEVRYSILSPKDITKQSIVKVITPEIYDKYGFPVEGGLMDLRMGVIEPGLGCKTCGQSYKQCEGHFGHLELARPILNVNFVDDIFMTLRCTCQECYRIMIAEDMIAETLAEHKAQRVALGPEKFAKYQQKFLLALSKIKT